MAGAAIAIALSVIPLIVVIEVSDGMIEGITRRFIELETGHIQLMPFEESSVKELSDVSMELMELPEVKYAAPVYRGTALIYSSGFRTGIQIKAFPGDMLEKDEGFRKYLEIIDGDFDLSDQSGIMLSREIARQLDITTGESVKMLTAKRTKSGKMILRPEQFVVKGIFSTGYYEVDALSGYIGLDKAEKLFSGEGQLNIQCKIDDPYNEADDAVMKIQKSLPIDMSATTWYRIQRSMYESLYTTRVLLIFIMAIILIVAAVNITSSMIIMVIERQQDIAILKSCGTGRRQIRNSFIITGMMTGIAGAAAGTAAGLIIAVNVNEIINFFQTASAWFNREILNSSETFSLLSASSYYLDEIPVDIDPQKITAVAAGAIVLSVIAAVMPARKAERMMPLEIMRKH